MRRDGVSTAILVSSCDMMTETHPTFFAFRFPFLAYGLQVIILSLLLRAFHVGALRLHEEKERINDNLKQYKKGDFMYWTLELASKLEDAPWPASKDELIDYAQRSGAPLEVIENLQEMEDEGEVYESIEDIWPDYPSKEDFFFNEEEY